MNNLSFQKFKGQLSERRYGGPEKGKAYNTLSPKMKAAVDDVYSMIDKTSDPLIGKVEGINLAATIAPIFRNFINNRSFIKTQVKCRFFLYLVMPIQIV